PKIRIPPRNGSISPELESLWAIDQSGRFSEMIYWNGLVRRTTNDPDPHCRSWVVRLLTDKLERLPADTARVLAEAASRETNVEVRAQLAASAKRLPVTQALPIVANLLRH